MLVQPTLLSIAGSDPSGGAGIQADLKTMTAIGVYGAAAITCLTIQNSYGVQGVQSLSVDFIHEQIQAVLVDHNVTHIKIGMTGNIAVINCLAKLLDTFNGEVIFDPVLSSTTGEPLLEDDALLTIKGRLLPVVSYLTPNISELQLISGNKTITDNNDALNCAKKLLQKYPDMKAIVVKGGHLLESRTHISDFLVQQGGRIIESRRKRLHNPNLHGTGCTYSSALSSYLCLNNEIVASFMKASEYMNNVIQAGNNISVSRNDTNGPLLHFLT
jgi:hydroxymethylpyrimidine/phosphomethylpyrimidine kinase